MLGNPPETSELKGLDSAACWRKPGDRAKRTMSARRFWEQEELQVYMGFQPPPYPNITLTRNPTVGRKHAWSLPAYHTLLSQPPDLVALTRAAAAFVLFEKNS